MSENADEIEMWVATFQTTAGEGERTAVIERPAVPENDERERVGEYLQDKHGVLFGLELRRSPVERIEIG